MGTPLRRLALLVAASAALCPPGARAGDSPQAEAAEPRAAACAQMESLGLYRRRAQDGPLDDLERVRRWLVASDFSDLQAASTAVAALSLPPEIFALHLGGLSPQVDFAAWIGALAHADFGALPLSPVFAEVAAEASTALVAAFDHCIARPGFHVWTETTRDPAVLEVHTRYVPGPVPSDPAIDRLVAEQGPDALPLDCSPALPRARRLLFVRRKPRLESDFVATCVRGDPHQLVEIRLETDDEVLVRVAPVAVPAGSAARPDAWTVAPGLACAAPDASSATEGLVVVTECQASTGERSRRSRPHSGWNSRAQARSLCPHRDLDAEATAALQLRCLPQEDGSVELLVEGELTARAGWSRRGCVTSGDGDEAHCPASARIDGETTTPLWVDLSSHHCLRVVFHEAEGTGEPANNGSRAFGPAHFTPDYLSLRDPHGAPIPLDAGTEVPLDVPGRWELRAGGSADRMPAGWRHTAARNDTAGTFRFRERLRLEFPEMGAAGTCGARATGSAP
jgi:hypothetical protein